MVYLPIPAPMKTFDLPHIISASIFKNGYAVVTRELDIPSGEDKISCGVPNAAFGTLWFNTTEGLSIQSAVSGKTTEPVKGQVSSIPQMVAANVGKTVNLKFVNKDAAVSAQIVSVTGELLIYKSGNATNAVNINTVTEISGDNLSTESSDSTETGMKLTFKLNNKNGGKIFVSSIEFGIAWTPSYYLDISDMSKAEFTGKAEIINDLGDFNKIDTKLVSGFPMVHFAGISDPMASQGAINDFVSLANSNFTSPNGAYDQSQGLQLFRMSPQVPQFAARSMGNGFGGGGFAGAPAPRDAMMEMAKIANPAASMDVAGGGEENGDLYFYTIPSFELKSGGRSYNVLVKSSPQVTEEFGWNDSDPTDPNKPMYTGGADPAIPVYHFLKFKNISDQPFSSGPITIVKNHEVIAQSTLTYTAKQNDALVPLSSAPGINPSVEVKEVARKAVTQAGTNFINQDRVTALVTLKIENTTDKDVPFKVVQEFHGRIVDSSDATVHRYGSSINEPNPSGNLEWKFPLKKNETKVITYKIEVIVPHRADFNPGQQQSSPGA